MFAMDEGAECPFLSRALAFLGCRVGRRGRAGEWSGGTCLVRREKGVFFSLTTGSLDFGAVPATLYLCPIAKT